MTDTHRIGGVDPWPAEKIAQLRKLRAEGKSYKECGEALGITRNAALAKAKRLKVPSPAKAAAPPKTVSRARLKPKPPTEDHPWKPAPAAKKADGPAVATKPMPKLRVVEVETMPRILANLGPHQCRWPLDDPGPGNMDRTLFCAADGVEDGHVYCEAHRQLARSAANGLAKYSAKELQRSLRRVA
jgi:hypothetical protein